MRTKATHWPSGEYLGSTSKPGLVIGKGRGSVPSAFIVAICSPPCSSKKSKAICRPSGDQSEKRPGSSVRVVTPLPSGFARSSGKAPVAGSKRRNAIGPFLPRKVACAEPGASASPAAATRRTARHRMTVTRVRLAHPLRFNTVVALCFIAGPSLTGRPSPPLQSRIETVPSTRCLLPPRMHDEERRAWRDLGERENAPIAAPAVDELLARLVGRERGPQRDTVSANGCRSALRNSVGGSAPLEPATTNRQGELAVVARVVLARPELRVAEQLSAGDGRVVGAIDRRGLPDTGGGTSAAFGRGGCAGGAEAGLPPLELRDGFLGVSVPLTGGVHGS